MNEKKQGLVEQFLDDICYPNRDEMIEKAREDRLEQDRTRRYEAIMQAMTCDIQHWPEQCLKIAKRMDLEDVMEILLWHTQKRYLAYCAVRYRYTPEAISEAFIKHLMDDVDHAVLGKLILKALDESIDEEL